MVRRRQRADEGKRSAVEQLVVVVGVLPGVVDQGEARALAVRARDPECPEAGDELAHHRPELGDVGAVARVGVADEGDAAVSGDDEAEPADAQVASFLLGMAALGDRGTLVARVDPGGEVRHVEHEPREVDREGLRGPSPRRCGARSRPGPPRRSRPWPFPKAPMAERGGGKARPAGHQRFSATTGKRQASSRDRPPGSRPRARCRSRAGAPASARRKPTTSSTVSATRRRRSICHTAATSPKARWRVGPGLAGTGLRQAGGDLLRRAEIALGDDPGPSRRPGRAQPGSSRSPRPASCRR